MKNHMLRSSTLITYTFLLGTFALAQVSNAGGERLDDGAYQRSAYPTKLVTPYIDLLVGVSPYDYTGNTQLGATAEFRAGVQVGRHMLIGTGFTFLTLDQYDEAIVLPLEFGYRSKDKNFDFVSTIGFSDLNFGLENESVEGKTFSVDVYMRPTISRKGLRVVIAAGGMLYDYGDYVFGNCFSCKKKTGPQFTFRLRAGLGF